MLTEKEQKYLLKLARDSINNKLSGTTIPTEPFFSEKLEQELGVFVTLNKDGDLRGCIGYVEGIKPLQTAVAEMAQAAAFEDPRFPLITRKELDSIDIEISVLTPLYRVENIEDIEIGKHGLVIEKGFLKGLLLPQVATEYNLDRIEFLQHTCQKAGLMADAWKEKDTRIYSFSAFIFSEKNNKQSAL